MWNFLFGCLLGAAFGAVAMLTAVRNEQLRVRIGIDVPQAVVCPRPADGPPACAAPGQRPAPAPSAAGAPSAGPAGEPDSRLLFDGRRITGQPSRP